MSLGLPNDFLNHALPPIAMSQTSGPEFDLEVGLKTRNRLKTRGLLEGDKSYEEVVSRLLDQTQNSITLAEFANRMIDSMDVSQLALHTESHFEDSDVLEFVVHTHDELGELLNDVHAVEVAGETFRFNIRTSTLGPQTSRRITLYAPDYILGMESVPISEGVPRAREWIVKHHCSDPSEHVGLRLVLDD